jgi:hypothetical protein
MIVRHPDKHVTRDPIPHLREMARCALWTAGLHRKAAETNVAIAARTRSARQQGEPQPGEWLESAERFLKVAIQHRHDGLALLRAVVEIRRLRARTLLEEERAWCT